MTVSFFEYKCNPVRYTYVKDGKNMKLITANRKDESGSSIQTREAGQNNFFGAVGEKVRGQIAVARENILAESRQAFEAPERLLRLALNEAEALAWQTTYPQLIFPTLATEKVQALVAWNATQRLVRQSSPTLSLTE